MLPNFNILKIINNEVSLIEINQNRFILKKTKDKSSVSSLFEYVILLLKLSIKNEYTINEAILSSQFRSNVPYLLYTDYKSFMIFEYLEAIDGIPINFKSMSMNKLILKNYLQFHKDLEHKEVTFSIFHKLYNINVSYLRASLYYLFELDTFINLIKVFFISNLSQKKIAYFLVHKDLKNYQNIMHDFKNIYFIDFANVNIESKWIMTDIVDLAFDLQTKKINFRLIMNYIDHMNNSKINYKAQVRFVLIRKFLNLIFYYKSINKLSISESNFLKSVLLNEIEYKRWLNENSL